MHTRPITGLLAALMAVVLAAGCGSSTPAASSASSASATASSEHNDADIAFVQGMIPHHAQAIEMAQMAIQKANSPQVKQLATAIQQAQQPEIDQMNGLLATWSVTSTPPTSGMAGMDPGGMTGMNPGGTSSTSAMPGMMSSTQMQQLSQASGAAFDRMFLQMMIEHHTGAITMAETELAKGRNTQAKALAQRIIDAQRAEITTMRQLLAAA
jgi:uncharacterized protein (DUF305 family)